MNCWYQQVIGMDRPIAGRDYRRETAAAMSAFRLEFHQTLSAALGPKPGIAVVHSSLSQLAPPAPLSPWDALYGFDLLVRAGWTIALPAFTFSFCGGAPYHHRTTRSETGILADWALAHLGDARRTPHPIYTFVVAGPAAEEISACASTTTFGDDSPFGLFERHNATLVMLGCGWAFCTQLHRYEEKAQVPYRHFKTFSGPADFGEGARPAQAAMYVRDLALDPLNDFSPAIEQMRGSGLIRSFPLCRGKLECAMTTDLAAQSSAMLQADPWVFVADAPTAIHRLKARRSAERQTPVRVAVLGSSNVELLRQRLASELQALMPEIRTEIGEFPYGQIRQNLLDPGSALHRFAPQISIYCDRLEDLMGQPFLNLADSAAIEAAVAEQAKLIADFHRRNGGWTVIARFAVLQSSASDPDRCHALVTRANALMEQALAGLDQVLWLDVAAEAAAEAAPALDPRLWYIGRFPFSDALTRRLAHRLVGTRTCRAGQDRPARGSGSRQHIMGRRAGRRRHSRAAARGRLPGQYLRGLPVCVEDADRARHRAGVLQQER